MSLLATGKISHVALVVNDLYKMEQFYRTVFNMQLNYRYSSVTQIGLRISFLKAENMELELMQYNGKQTEKKWAGHIAFASDDVDVEYGRMSDMDVPKLSQPRESGDGYREFALEDPEGNTIEVVQKIKQYITPKLKGVIFDLDGTLIDSEPNYYEADKQWFESFGETLTPEMKVPYIGMGNLAMVKDVKQKYNLPQSAEEMLKWKQQRYLELARKNTRAFPQMKKLVQMLMDRGLMLAVASGSGREIIEELLVLTGLREFFKVVISSEEVENHKPHPDIIEECARRMEIKPYNLAVVEDSRYGVEAGVRAGMRVLAVPESYQAGLDPAFKMAEMLVKDGMKTFDPDRALAWLVGE